MEESNKRISKTKWLDIVLVLLLAVVPLLLMYHYDVTVVFFNNDDVFLGELVSGITTGRPESHLVHVGYLLGFVLSRLYMVWPSISWYGMFLFVISYISIIYAFSIMLLRLENVWQKLLYVLATWCVLFSFFFYHLNQLQFTTVTTIVCMISLVNFLMLEEVDECKTMVIKALPSFIFFVISLCIRMDACVMVLPFFIAGAVAKYLKNNRTLKPVMVYIMGIICLVTIIFTIDQVAYLQGDWKETKDFSAARSQLVDYAGYPVYEENINLYEGLGISEQSYISMATRYQILLDENINTDMYVALQEATKLNQSRDIYAMVKYFFERHLKDMSDRPLNIAVYFMYIFAIVMIFLSRKYKALYEVLAIFCSRMIIWIYLLYIGRIPPRVTQGVYIVEFMVLMTVIVSNQLWKDREKEKAKVPMIGGIFVVAAILVVCGKWGLPYSQRIYYNNQSQMVFSSCYREIREYFTANPENVYLGDTMSFSYYNKDIFAKEYPSAGNFVIMGSWIANTQWTDSIAERYQIESYEEAAIYGDNVYFVCMDSKDTPWQYLADYYAEKYPGSVMEVEEVVETTFGQNFLILKVRQG